MVTATRNIVRIEITVGLCKGLSGVMNYTCENVTNFISIIPSLIFKLYLRLHLIPMSG